MIINHNFSVPRPTHARTPGAPPLSLTSRSRPGRVNAPFMTRLNLFHVCLEMKGDFSVYKSHLSIITDHQVGASHGRSLIPSFVLHFGQNKSFLNWVTFYLPAAVASYFNVLFDTPNNGKEVPRWGVAEIQKMSPSTTGRCK